MSIALVLENGEDLRTINATIVLFALGNYTWPTVVNDVIAASVLGN